MFKRYGIFAMVLCAVVVSAVRAESGGRESSVRVWEEALTIPTYEAAAPDPAPLFYDGRTYQGAKGPFYPYPITDRLLNTRKDKTYKAVYLENKYLKICVLPELGGRIFEAVDKTNGYNFFYRQHVIKPALIGMLGAWISGGVEWNIPHHHRASSFSPVPYKTEEKPGGSKTIWVGEMELRHRMRWVVGLTLHPDKAYLEGTVRLINRTPVSHTFLYFANVAVHTNKDYQVIFPPSVQWATQHSKSEFSRWPIGDGVYGGVDFKGVDVSWWKNHPRPISMFAHECKEDFLAGYDHGKQAGTLHVADHGTMPGKKFFTWGTGDEGKTWDKILTDTDGPYLELMVGGFSDNQPDYSWIQPYEVKEVTHCWYPFQKIGGVKNATREAAVNLEVTADHKAKVGFCTTSGHHEAKVMILAGSKTLLEETITIEPGKPYWKELVLPEGTKEEDLKVSLSAPETMKRYNGEEVVLGTKELVAYQPVHRERSDKPKPVEPPAAPKDIKTNEELYLAGMRLQQFYSPAKEPDPYFEEALRRDPGDYRANVALGILHYNRGMFDSAEKLFRAGVERATKNYTAPRDGEALYYLGLVLKAQGKDDAAYEALSRASWSLAWNSAASYALAELACKRSGFDQALTFLSRSLSTNSQNTKALELNAAVERAKTPFVAWTMANRALAVDPLDSWALRERRLGRSGSLESDEPRIVVTSGLFDDVQPYLEMAFDYTNAGLYDDGIKALKELVAAYPDKSRIDPMVYYCMGYLEYTRGRRTAAFPLYQQAGKLPPDYCFPFRLEEMTVLHHAREVNPNDARAPFYLGNLLYDRQPAEAIKLWEKSRELDGSLAMVHRNLAWGYARIDRNNDKAIASLEKAVALKDDPRFIGELDQLYEVNGAPAAKRLAFLEKHHDAVLLRDDVLSREVRLHIGAGHYDTALALLRERQWNVWEGGASVHDLYVDALLFQGHQFMKEKKYADALKNYGAALEYPENFSVGKPYRGDRSPQLYYHIGTADEALGKKDAAKEAFEKSVAGVRGGGRGGRGASGDAADILYCQARAFEKLGKSEEAKKLFESLIQSGNDGLSGGATVDYFAKFGERQAPTMRQAHAHYLLGLGYLGSGKPSEAKAEFKQALKLNPNHLGAKYQLSEQE